MKKEKLSEWEWTLIWSSMRYFMGRQTIASAMWPHDLLKNSYSKLDSRQIKQLHKDLEEHFKDFGKFGNKEIDSPAWEKLMIFLSGKRFIITAEGSDIKRQEIECFQYGDKYIPIDGFVSSSIDQYVHEPYIKEIREK
jgi:hypothetical protein